MAKRDNTASGDSVCGTNGPNSKGMAPYSAVVQSNRRSILGTFSPEETITLGAMLDRLDALEAAVRVRPNAKAIAALRESVEIDLAMDGEPETRLAAHATSILLDMLDKVIAAGAPTVHRP